MAHHPLLADLDEDQLHLIDVVARPWRVSNLADQLGWPTWDFVRRRFELNRPQAPSAEEVLGSLPTIQVSQRTYGLVWRTEPASGLLRPTERVGLTMAGLSHLHPRPSDVSLVDLVAMCLGIIQQAVNLEAELAEEMDWTQVASGRLDLRTECFGQNSTAPVEIVGQVLIREFVPLAASTSQHNYEVSCGQGKFKLFARVTTIEDYLFVADSLAKEETAPELPPSPLALPAALDYLGLAVRAHAEWNVNDDLVALPGFEAAASVCQLPSSHAEFEQRCSELWNIIGRLRVPEAAAAAYKDRNWENKGSLNSLDIWLHQHVGTEEYDLTCRQAIATLRALGKVRQGGQHASRSTKTNRSMALHLLGLPDLITDWASAWGTLLDQSARAVHAISMAVRRSQ